MTETYRVQSMDHQPGAYGPAYGDCWLPVMPNRRYTRIETALRIMREHAAALMDIPAFERGLTRVVEVDPRDYDRVIRVVDSRNHKSE